MTHCVALRLVIERIHHGTLRARRRELLSPVYLHQMCVVLRRKRRVGITPAAVDAACGRNIAFMCCIISVRVPSVSIRTRNAEQICLAT